MPALLRYRSVMSKQLTIQGVSGEVEQREAAVGVDERRARLARYVTWTPEDLVEFDEALAAQRTIDEPLWR
jgi:hypothetical protein